MNVSTDDQSSLRLDHVRLGIGLEELGQGFERRCFSVLEEEESR
jgi:hypothetical protein